MTFRDEETALRERLSQANQNQLESDARIQALEYELDQQRSKRAPRWFSLIERVGAFIGEAWLVTFWGLAVVGTAMLIIVTVMLEPRRAEPVACLGPPATITPLGATCNNICSQLGSRQVSHTRHSDGYTCVCLSSSRSCVWNSIEGADCETLP